MNEDPPLPRAVRAAEVPDAQGVIDPVRAGAGIFNSGSGELGTLGLLLTSDGADRWVLSCYHVLGRPYVNGLPQPFVHGDEICQPGAGGQGRRIAGVQPGMFLAMPDRGHDAAAVRLGPGVPFSDGVLGIDGIDRVPGVIAPEKGMRVIKSGRASGVTRGVITRVDYDEAGSPISIEVDYDPDADDGIVTRPGDSGAVWIDAGTGMGVAMNNGQTAQGLSTAVALGPVLGGLGLRLPS